VFSDIVKRGSIRASSWRKPLAGAHTLFKSASLTARRRIDLEESKLVFLINVPPLVRERQARRVRWALIMRAIKCLKGIRWMPWR
jgi:uncharacterized membrane protein YhaH (DUF805 family)